MKKLFTILAASLILAGSVSAQGLSSLLGGLTSGNSTATNVVNGLSSVVYAFTGNTNAVSLPGTWVYNGAAVGLASSDASNVISNLGGTAASAAAASKLDEYLAKIGITPGAMTFTFNEDLSFTCTIRNIPITGTWKTLNDGNTLQLQFGKVMKFLTLTGDLKKTATGCEVLFQTNALMSFLKSALSVVAKQSNTASTFTSLTDKFDKMQMGFKLVKQ